MKFPVACLDSSNKLYCLFDGFHSQLTILFRFSIQFNLIVRFVSFQSKLCSYKTTWISWVNKLNQSIAAGVWFHNQNVSVVVLVLRENPTEIMENTNFSGCFSLAHWLNIHMICFGFFIFVPTTLRMWNKRKSTK